MLRLTAKELNWPNVCKWPMLLEKGFLAAVRRRAFQKQASIGNIDSSMLDFGFNYCSFPPVRRS
jgi:hypothetical protein